MRKPIRPAKISRELDRRTKSDRPNNGTIDEWDRFRSEIEPVGLEELKSLQLSNMPNDIRLLIRDDYFPETIIWRTGKHFVCEIEEHLYTKYWEHKFSAYAFAEAMERAVRRLMHEGHPFTRPSRVDDDVNIFVRWHLRLPRTALVQEIIDSIKHAFDLVWHRADSILENSDSVLILGKDHGAALDRLKAIASKLDELGYYTYIIKEQPDRLGESVIQKVLRYALSSKFVLIENTEVSGHLYEIPHVTKAAECVTVVLQEEKKGATWMFEDAYAKHKHWHKLIYRRGQLERAVEDAIAWAENFRSEFADYRVINLPWLKSG